MVGSLKKQKMTIGGFYAWFVVDFTRLVAGRRPKSRRQVVFKNQQKRGNGTSEICGRSSQSYRKKGRRGNLETVEKRDHGVFHRIWIHEDRYRRDAHRFLDSGNTGNPRRGVADGSGYRSLQVPAILVPQKKPRHDQKSRRIFLGKPPISSHLGRRRCNRGTVF